MKVGIVGAGLAGLSAAYFLKQSSVSSIVFDCAPDIASNASGNELGLYNPRFLAEYNFQAQFYARAFECALELFEGFGDGITHHECGALHLMNTEQKQKRYPKMLQAWPWDDTMIRIVSADLASDIAGVNIEADALYLPRSGMVSPKKLCEAYAERSECELRLGQKIENLSALYDEVDIVIIASGQASSSFEETSFLPIKPIRGQVTKIETQSPISGLKSILCYGGYSTVGFNGIHIVGSSFDRGVDDNYVSKNDDEQNLEKLFSAIPSVQSDYKIVGSRASVRAAAPDHFPVIGRLNDRLYMSAAHGSHGLISSLMGARILTAMITGGEIPVEAGVIEALSPRRFSC